MSDSLDDLIQAHELDALRAEYPSWIFGRGVLGTYSAEWRVDTPSRKHLRYLVARTVADLTTRIDKITTEQEATK